MQVTPKEDKESRKEKKKAKNNANGLGSVKGQKDVKIAQSRDEGETPTGNPIPPSP